MNLLSDYEVKVIKFLDELKIGESCRVHDWCKIKNRVEFVEAIKLYIDMYGKIELNVIHNRFKRVMTYDETIEYFNNNKLNNKREKK